MPRPCNWVLTSKINVPRTFTQSLPLQFIRKLCHNDWGACNRVSLSLFSLLVILGQFGSRCGNLLFCLISLLFSHPRKGCFPEYTILYIIRVRDSYFATTVRGLERVISKKPNSRVRGFRTLLQTLFDPLPFSASC